MKFEITGPVLLPDGYGEMARQLSLGLLEAGQEVFIRSVTYGNPVSLQITPEAAELYPRIVEHWVPWQTGAVQDFDCDVHIQCHTPDVYSNLSRPNGFNVGYTMWETDRLPKNWTECCNAMDLILTPSEFCRKVFLRSGVRSPVALLPIGTDTTKFDSIVANPEHIAAIHGLYPFYSIFHWNERKNPSALLAAYFREFYNDEPVVLLLKTYPWNDTAEGSETILRAVEKICTNVGRTSENTAPVICITEGLSTPQILSLHRLGRCYVAPIRGEGWGLPVFDAALAGNHVICTVGQSCDEFLDSRPGEVPSIHDLIPFRLTPVNNMPSPYSSDQNWAEIDLAALQKALRKAFETRDDSSAAQTRMAWATKMRARFHRKQIAEQLVKIIQSNMEKIHNHVKE